jgi:hypothetical protein
VAQVGDLAGGAFQQIDATAESAYPETAEAILGE